jgi:GPH family glycoside/pentoside/hexuronide:cation symporter
MVDSVAATQAPVPLIPAAPGLPARALSPKQKTLYSFGDVAEGMTNSAINEYLVFYLTVACALSGSVAGAAAMVALVVDAIFDPIIGYVSDNTRSKWGRRHPYMYASALPFALGLGLLYTLPAFDSEFASFIYVVCALLLLRISFSTFILPYAALGAELVTDYTERSTLMNYRWFINNLAHLLTIVLGFGVFMSGDAILDRDAYIPFAWVCAAIVFGSILMSSRSTYPLRHRLHELPREERSAISRLVSEVRDVARSRSFLILMSSIMVFWAAQGAAIAVSIHALKYFWEFSSDLILVLMVAGTIGHAFGTPLSHYLLNRFEKRVVCAMTIVLVCLAHMTPPTLHILGLAPEPGLALNIMVISFYAFVAFVLTSVVVSHNSMMADAVDEHDHRFGSRREALFFAGVSFGGKCALGLGALIAGVALDVIKFPRDLAANPDQVIPHDTVTNLGLFFGPGAAILALFSAVIIFYYTLDKERLTSIQRDLAARRDPTKGS